MMLTLEPRKLGENTLDMNYKLKIKTVRKRLIL